MRSLLVFLLLVATTHATFGLLASLLGGGCGPCGGGGMGGGLGMGGGYGGGAMDYGAGYGGNYGGSMMGLSGLNAPGSYFQPMGQGMGQTLYAGQSYFTPADGGYGGGSSYGGSYGQPYANAQIVNNIPYMHQASGGSYAVPQPSYRQPLPIPRARPTYTQPAPPPLPVEEVPETPPQIAPQEGYVQPAASVRPYEAVPHAAPQASVPAEAPATEENESEDYSETETETQAPAVQTTTNYAAAQVSNHEENQVHMINSPEEAGYRKVLKRRLLRKKTLA